VIRCRQGPKIKGNKKAPTNKTMDREGEERKSENKTKQNKTTKKVMNVKLTAR